MRRDMSKKSEIFSSCISLIVLLIHGGIYYVMSSFLTDDLPDIQYHIQGYFITFVIVVIITVIKIYSQIFDIKKCYYITVTLLCILGLISFGFIVPCLLSMLKFFGVPSLYLTIFSINLWIETIISYLTLYGVFIVLELNENKI